MLAAGAKADSGTGAAVDVTGAAALKLTAVMSADMSLAPSLRLLLETAPASTGPWREAWCQTFMASMGGTHSWPASGKQSIALTPDNFIRARWETKHRSNFNADSTVTCGLSLAITGLGIEDT